MGTTSDTPEVTDRAAAAGRQLALVARNGECFLESRGRSLPLAPKAPCHFLRSSAGAQPQMYGYEDVKTEAVLIVSGTPASEATRATWNLPPEEVCGEESQGVLIRGGEVVVTAAVRKGGVTCRDKGVDEKEYWAFAHDEK